MLPYTHLVVMSMCIMCACAQTVSPFELCKQLFIGKQLGQGTYWLRKAHLVAPPPHLQRKLGVELYAWGDNQVTWAITR